MTPPDRLRELLDAVTSAGPGLDDLAKGAYASPFHFSRQVRAGAGEPPVTLRRRVGLERAAWRLRSGASVTEVAWEAGYSSVEGFARAYQRAWGYPPSDTPTGGGPTAHWLLAPNGVHFHSPTALWVEAAPSSMADPVSDLMLRHDLADAEHLLRAAAGLDAADWERAQLPGLMIMHWCGPEESLALLLGRVIGSLEVWLAGIEGSAPPPQTEPDTPGHLLDRLARIGPRWLDRWRDIARRGAWHDSFIDAICDPPESFALGSVLAHTINVNAQRRGIARVLLRQAGHLSADDDGDPITWLRE